MADKPIRNIYVAADALWDLRQGTLTHLNPTFAVAVTTDSDYYVRDTDVFTAFGQTLKPELYEKISKKFTHEILRCSMRTEILDFLSALCAEYFKATPESPTLERFGVEINTYPFNLSDEERAELLARMASALGNLVPVSLSHYSPEELTMGRVRLSYKAMIMYNYHNWLNMHNEELKKEPLMTVGLYVPRLFFADKAQVTDEIRRELVKRGKDEFEMLSEILKPFLGIQFLPISFFSAATPMNRPSFRELVKK